MAVLTVRNLPDEVHDILARAALESERCRSAKVLRERVKRHYGLSFPGNVVDEFIAERRREAERE